MNYIKEMTAKIPILKSQIDNAKKVLFQSELVGISLTRQFKIKALISEEIDELTDTLLSIERYLEASKSKSLRN